MTVWQALILGILQGLTEFLPVSSSGHLILASRLMGIQPSVSMELALHAATLFAVALYYRKQLFGLVRRPLSAKSLYLHTKACWLAMFFDVIVVRSSMASSVIVRKE